MGVAVRGWLALVLELGFFGLAVGVRMLMQKRRTGGSGFKMQKLGATASEKAVEALTGVAGITVIAATIFAIAGNALGGPDELAPAVAAIAVAFGLLAIAGTFWAQLAMGDSWRIGQDRDETTALVTGGPFQWVRNPIYTAMITFFAATFVLIPSLVTLVGLVATIVAIEVVVREVEEPFLRRQHGPAYATWCAQTGRFLPYIGRK